ncbi:MAG: hypothetical protein K5781_08815 [Nitrosopumilus sp.]|nr:hypothetical protein [Nitrosopumilus sp.]
MIFQKTNPKYYVLILVGCFFLVMFFLFSNNSCDVNYFMISTDISSYEQSLDPEFCENILERIDLYNDMCPSQIEILDCG